MNAYIRDGHINIRVPIKALSAAYKGCIDLNARRKGYENFRIVDEKAFAKDLVMQLNEDDEEGTTMVDKMLDRAMECAIEQGAEGVAEVKHLPHSDPRRRYKCYGAGNDCKCPIEEE